jgi:hypothetical protein
MFKWTGISFDNLFIWPYYFIVRLIGQPETKKGRRVLVTHPASGTDYRGVDSMIMASHNTRYGTATNGDAFKTDNTAQAEDQNCAPAVEPANSSLQPTSKHSEEAADQPTGVSAAWSPPNEPAGEAPSTLTSETFSHDQKDASAGSKNKVGSGKSNRRGKKRRARGLRGSNALYSAPRGCRCSWLADYRP